MGAFLPKKGFAPLQPMQRSQIESKLLRAHGHALVCLCAGEGDCNFPLASRGKTTLAASFLLPFLCADETM